MNVMEMSDIHWETMFGLYIYTDSSCLENVSQWE